MSGCSFAAIRDVAGTVIDVRAMRDGREFAMLGEGGARRECALLENLPKLAGGDQSRDHAGYQAGDHAGYLPVLLGTGMGFALEALLRQTSGPVAIIDKETDLLQLTGVRDRFSCTSSEAHRMLWITDASHDTALVTLDRWRKKHGNLPCHVIGHPFYARLDREWYRKMRIAIETAPQISFWEKAIQPRFVEKQPRVLLITSKYFLMGELRTACQRLGIPHLLLTLNDSELGGSEFVEGLLKAVVTFRPDCVLTMNHLGVDREGVLVDLLSRLQLPLASWFVDNPELILHSYRHLANPWSTIFTWDRDNIDRLHELGYEHVHYVPLGTDPRRFRPQKKTGASVTKAVSGSPDGSLFPARVSFVGNSMVYKVGLRLKAAPFPRVLLLAYRRLATFYAQSDERSVQRFLMTQDTGIQDAYQNLANAEDRLAYETLLTWEATRQYRTRCVEQTLPFKPVIVGDRGWFHTLKPHDAWKRHPEVSYYEGLPQIYQSSEINFNCTSQQMKGAVNQRIFDIPAAGGFVLTDWREQMDQLLEPGKEIICYREPEEASDLIRYYLKRPNERNQIIRAGRKRVLAEHTWEHRVLSMLAMLKEIYG